VFHLTAFENIKLDTERRGYLVKGLLPDTGLGVIWGPPKCYKSFWAVDVGLHIALGLDYRGRRVEQVGVVYIGLEGRQGLPARIEAFKKHHGVDRALFHLITAPLNLKKQVDVLIADIEAHLLVPPGIVFIDTLNRSLAGSESKDEDMAAYLAAAAKIEQKFNCLVVLVHHCGIEGTRPRGHTSLTAAVDVQLAVERLDDRQMSVRVELAKRHGRGSGNLLAP
jgi:RecA-family ATPase